MRRINWEGEIQINDGSLAPEELVGPDQTQKNEHLARERKLHYVGMEQRRNSFYTKRKRVLGL